MYEVIISGENASLNISILGLESPQATNKSDASWLTCKVKLYMPNLTADYDAFFTIGDFLSFKKDIEKALICISGKPTAIFQTDEDMLYVKLEFGLTGKIFVSVVSRIYGQPSACLNFSYETDRYSIEQTLGQLQKIKYLVS
jgi:hypothetical protein